MPIFDHFDLLAPFYERAIQTRAPATLISLAQLPVTGALLDAGGGTGRVAQSLQGQAGQMVVADFSSGMLRQAVGKKDLAAVQAQTEALPFAAQTFERIIMIDALHHVYDQRRTAHELWRLLKTGGRLVIEEPDVRTALVKGIALIEKLALMRSHFLDPQQIAALFQYPGARASIYRGNYQAWIVVEKAVEAT